MSWPRYIESLPKKKRKKKRQGHKLSLRPSKLRVLVCRSQCVGAGQHLMFYIVQHVHNLYEIYNKTTETQPIYGGNAHLKVKRK